MDSLDIHRATLCSSTIHPSLGWPLARLPKMEAYFSALNQKTDYIVAPKNPLESAKTILGEIKYD